QFSRGSLRVAEAMADCKGFTVIGGGDSVSAANMAKVADRIDHISTGGGASLEFLEGTMLPGVKVLLK
ncbi:MAG: phosphoglycerate kinase, partial [Proteobacteria bacterium]